MREASYAVVRYIADPGRNEPLNVGVIVWTEAGYALKIDEKAVARVVRENPRLERDALLYLESYLRRELKQRKPPFTKEGFLRIIAEQPGYPVLISEPRLTTLATNSKTEIQKELGRLVDRIVTPRRRSGGGSLKSAVHIERELRDYVEQQKILRHHSVVAHRTGVMRSIDFFANSHANVALDVVNLALAGADVIRNRADAEAFKIWDLVSDGQIKDYLVFCEFSSDEGLEETNQSAERILTSTGGRLTRDIDEAIDILASSARGPQLFP